MKNKRLASALRWIERGASIVPLRSGTKKPAAGFSSLDPISTKKALIAHFLANPDHNYGICGGGELGLLIVDLDVKDGKNGRTSLASLESAHGALPKTVTVLSANGGRHLYFASGTREIPNSVGRVGEGIDIRASGGYVVGPGCELSTGGHYRYLKDHSPKQIEIAEAPQWLVEAAMGRLSQPLPAAQAGGDASATVQKGSRNDALTSFAGKMHRDGHSPEVVMAATKAHNTTACQPPLDDAEVETIVASVTRYAPGDGRDGDIGAFLAQAILDRHYASGERLLRAQDGRFWAFTGRLWAPVEDNVIRQHALAIWKALPKPKPSADLAMRQALSVLTAQVAVADDRLRFGGDPVPVINCANGELWLLPNGQHELRPHQATSYLRTGINVAYDPNATCPRFDRAVSEMFANAREAATLQAFLAELIGYILQPGRQIPIVAIFQGPGRNGKSAIAETITRLLGYDLVAAMRIKELGNSRFSIADLLGKHVFIDDDVQAGLRLPDGDLKRLSEAKLMKAERKYGQSFQFIARAVPLMLCNGQPSLADLSEGMRRRLVVVPFDRIFTEREIDRTLFPAIWATELPGILNVALAGWKRVVDRGYRFELPDDVKRTTKAWIRSANPVPEFVEARCVKNGGDTIMSLYAAYGNFCEANGITLKQQAGQFKRNLELLGFDVKKGRDGNMAVGLSLKT